MLAPKQLKSSLTLRPSSRNGSQTRDTSESFRGDKEIRAVAMNLGLEIETEHTHITEQRLETESIVSETKPYFPIKVSEI